MTPDEARHLLVDVGTITQIRLGNDPGAEKMLEFRHAIRVLFWHWHLKESLPYDIVAAASLIVWFRQEMIETVQRGGHNRLENELQDLLYMTFDLLSGPEAAPRLHRPDLGEPPPKLL